MLKLKNSSSSRQISSFFIEIILVVLFFAISCSILVKVYAKAYEQNTKTNQINSATLNGQNLSQSFSGCGDIKLSLENVFGEDFSANIKDDTATLNFDNDWNISDFNAKYSLTINTSSKEYFSGVLKVANIDISYNDESIFSTTSSRYLPNEEVENE